MSKRFKVVQSPSASYQSTETNWELCCLCQTVNAETLVNPGSRGVDAGYKSLAKNIERFDEIDCLPSNLNIHRLNEGEGLLQTFIQRNAKYHKKCSLDYNNVKLHRAEKRVIAEREGKTSEAQDTQQGKRFLRGCSTPVESVHDPLCFFCEQPADSKQPLHKAMTFELHERVLLCATALQKDNLLAKLTVGDMVAIDAEYHLMCLVKLYNEYRLQPKSKEQMARDNAQRSAFAELVNLIESNLYDNDVAPVFILSDLKHMYKKRIEVLGGSSDNVHSTRLKEKILGYFPELDAHREGRNILLVPNEVIGKSLRLACAFDAEGEAVTLARAATIVRRDILEMQKSKTSHVDSVFLPGCQKQSVPNSLATLVSMILNGSSIESQQHDVSQPTLTILQLVVFNCFSHRREDAERMRRTMRQETPLPLFVGAAVHSKTRSKDLLNTLHSLGISVTYDRVMNLSADAGNSAVAYFNSIGSVCHPQLKIGIFTTSAVDNIDHNPSATSADGSFHGTAISLFQYPTVDKPGINQEVLHLVHTGKKVKALPTSYTSVPPVVGLKTSPLVPTIPPFNLPAENTMSDAVKKETAWCAHVSGIISNTYPLDSKELHVSWAAYHSSPIPLTETTENKIRSETALLPLFPDDSKSIAMMRHSITIARKATEFLNPGQVPVIACDQPLFKLMKDIQWTWPYEYGEDKVVVLLGGLHIKLALLKSIGDLLSGSGWTSALAQANVASSGTSDSFLKAVHIKKTLRAHQVTACALFHLRQNAYEEYSSDNALTFDEWRVLYAERYPQFQFWDMILRIQQQIFTWDRAIHQGDFPLYVNSLYNLHWIFHATDHINYVRAVGMHLRDMFTLHDTHPDIYAEFCKGNFTVNMSGRPFSRMPIDEAHEHNNAVVKGDGGAIGLTENPSRLLRWMVSGPAMAQLVSAFMTDVDSNQRDDNGRHHEDTSNKQVRFVTHVRSMVQVMEGMGNPFEDTGKDLMVLDTREILDPSVASTMQTLECLGKEQSHEFMKSRLVSRTDLLADPIKKNKLPFMSSRPVKHKSKDKEQVASLKRDRGLFSRMYIASQRRDGDPDTFFSYENSSTPPSLSAITGEALSGNKSDLLDMFEEVTQNDLPQQFPPGITMIVMDGPAVVHYLYPDIGSSYGTYAQKYGDYIRKLFIDGVRRVDVIFDIYKEDSLKSETRTKRGKGCRMKVEENKQVAKDWKAFLRVDGNKRELFQLIAKMLSNMDFPGKVVVTHGDEAFCNSQTYINLSPCNHEEADSRIFLHVADGVQEGCEHIMVKTVDTDVVVLAISLEGRLQCRELWVALGSSRSTIRLFNVSENVRRLGVDTCEGLLAFHSITGCDTTSKFNGRGKKTAWSTWMANLEVTQAFRTLSHTPSIEDVASVLNVIERFTVLLYDRCSEETDVNKARVQLFTQKAREIENIPPTKDALHQHVLRAAYQAGHVWCQALNKIQTLPKPEDFGWTRKNNTWVPRWITQPQASEGCRVIIKCGCQKGCKGRCSCHSEQLRCIALCKCGGCDDD